jgi:hypothetical protein
MLGKLTTSLTLTTLPSLPSFWKTLVGSQSAKPFPINRKTPEQVSKLLNFFVSWFGKHFSFLQVR